MKRPVLVALAALTLPAAAQAQEEPRFCPNRPDLGASGCTTEPGHVQFEVSAIDWQRDDTADAREDMVLGGDFQARIGVGGHTEVQLGWTPLGRSRTRDKASGTVETKRGVGDIRLGVRQGLTPAGSALSVGIQPFASLPTGKAGIGEGDWGAGAVLPVSYDLSERWHANFTSEVDAAVNESGHGRHLAYSGIAGLGYDISDAVSVVGEVMVERDDDPLDHATHALAAGSIAWQPRHGLQLDVLATAGLNHDTPDFRLVTGGAVLF